MRPVYLQSIGRRLFVQRRANRIYGVLLAVAIGVFAALLVVHELAK